MAHRRPEDIETNEDARLPKQKGGTRAKKQTTKQSSRKVRAKK
jgi:hypothetical protein